MTIASYQALEAQPQRSWIELMSPAIELAKAVANTDFVPKGMRGNPAAITAAILYGDEVGIGPMQSLARIAVIDGRPTLYAETQRALILAAGHELWVEDATSARVTVAGKRRDHDNVTRVTWTMDDAKRAGLSGKHSWRTYPRQMLLARASAELARALFPDVIGGLSAIEELDADVEGTPEEPTQKTTRKRRQDRPALQSVEEPPAEEPADVPPEDPMSEAQKRRLFALYRDKLILGRAERLTFASEVVGREVKSTSELTMHEAGQVMDALEKYGEEEPENITPAQREAEDMLMEQTTPAAEREPEPDAAPMPTQAQLEWLDARYLKSDASAAQLWTVLADWRGVNVDGLLTDLHGRDANGQPYWAPLRATLTREETKRMGELLQAYTPHVEEGDE